MASPYHLIKFIVYPFKRKKKKKPHTYTIVVTPNICMRLEPCDQISQKSRQADYLTKPAASISAYINTTSQGWTIYKFTARKKDRANQLDISIQRKMMMMMMMKKMNVVVVLLVLCVMASNVEQSLAQVSCYDACSTHCAVQYMKKPKLMARCDRKCSEKCRRGGKGEFQVEENIN